MKVLGMEMRMPMVRQSQPEAPTQEANTATVADGSEAVYTAAVEFGLGLLARAFMSATVTPQIAAITPEYLAGTIIDLITKGNHIAALMVVDGEIILRRAEWFNIIGGADPSGWVYRINVAGPTTSELLTFPQDQVVHIRYNPSAVRPWDGRSPLRNARISAELLARIETSLDQEMNGIVAKIVTHPHGMLATMAEHRAAAQAISNSKGRATYQSTGQRAYDRGTGGSWAQIGLGPEPNATAVALRTQVSQDILSAMGVPSGLYVSNQGTVSREAYRQFYASTVRPYAAIIERELSVKLRESIRLRFHALAAADIVSRVRAYTSLVDSGMDASQAALITDIEG